jgi:hypothetical protein
VSWADCLAWAVAQRPEAVNCISTQQQSCTAVNRQQTSTLIYDYEMQFTEACSYHVDSL